MGNGNEYDDQKRKKKMFFRHEPMSTVNMNFPSSCLEFPRAPLTLSMSSRLNNPSLPSQRGFRTFH
jgi:hypothetical protein